MFQTSSAVAFVRQLSGHVEEMNIGNYQLGLTRAFRIGESQKVAAAAACKLRQVFLLSVSLQAPRHRFHSQPTRAFTDSVCLRMRFADWRVAVERVDWLSQGCRLENFKTAYR